MKNIIVVIVIGLIGFFVLNMLGVIGGPERISKKKAIELAAFNLIGKKKFGGNPPTDVELKNEIYTVRFHFQVPGGKPGDTYFSYVKMQAKDGELIELGVDGLEDGPATGNPDPYRSSPLNEEVDEVGNLQKQMGY